MPTDGHNRAERMPGHFVFNVGRPSGVKKSRRSGRE
jgi:hypothetical protein